MQANNALKHEAIALRKKGVSMIAIESRLGVARSTLSGWLKETPLTTEQKSRLKQIPNSLSVLELALAMLYWGEGSKGGTMSIGNADPQVLKFFIAAVSKCYNLSFAKLRCDLHLRMDQDANELKKYWQAALDLPASHFRSISYDKRTAHKPTHSYYKGVCQVYFGNIALQRRLFFVYTHYCNRVMLSNRGT